MRVIEKFLKFIWVCRAVDSKVCQGVLTESKLPPELLVEFAEEFLKQLVEAGGEVIGYRIDKTGAEIAYRILNGKEAEVMQKLLDAMKEERT